MKDTEMLQDQINTMEHRLLEAVNRIRGVDEMDEDYQKSYPFAAGYAQATMVDVIHELRGMRKYLLEE